MAWSRYQASVYTAVFLVGFLSTLTAALPRMIRAPTYDETSDSGSWGRWGQWSSCSRSCGGGVSYQERQCLEQNVDGSPSCTGQSRRYESCNIQECPEGSLDFRAEQCANFNAVPFEGKYYQWVPYLGASNKCELNCMPKDQHFYYRLKETVVDGTMCNPDSLDACVQGVCERVGCDYMLGSDAEEDKCRECGGDGTQCKTIADSFSKRNLPVGYNDFLIIPAGATNIRVEERKPTNNFLALRNANGQYYINGNFSIDFPQPFSIAGTTVHYERSLKSGKRNNAPEVLRALGPTSEPLFVVLVTQEKNKGILYEYSVLADSDAATKPDTYSWIFGSYDECTRSCGKGNQLRDVSCARNSDFKIVPDYLCEEQEKPATNRSCNVDPCPPRWHLGEWSTCSKECGSGEQVRLVYCEQQQGAQSKMVSDDHCAKIVGPKPSYRQQCNTDPCPDWEVSDWSKCSEECGNGIQTRQVTCNVNSVVSGITCDENDRPVEQQQCNLGPCYGVSWLVSDWTQCSQQCGHGMKTRQIYCGSSDGVLYKNDLCEGQPQPKMMLACKSKAACNGEWHTTEWSECSAECGEGMRGRNAICARQIDGSWRRVPEIQCRESDKPATIEHCNDGPCETPMWLLGQWTECTAPCDGGQRDRYVMCFGGNGALSDDACEVAKPESLESCNTHLCEEETGSGNGELTPCSESMFGCCPDGVTTPIGPRGAGCPPGVVRPPVVGSTTLTPVSPLGTARSALTPTAQSVTTSYTTPTPPLPTTEITCTNTQFGCCENGIDTATGPNYRGCDKERVPPPPDRNDLHEYERHPSDLCAQPHDSGTLCEDYIIKWYFDTDYSRCTQFWYGGCDGNSNRFETEDECKLGCGDGMNEIPQEDLCILPKSVGPCKAAIPSFFYNPESASCEHFLYGGCRGNGNRFRSQQECEILCSSLSADPCTLPRDAGRCTGQHKRFYFDQSSQQCEEFYYTGCHGNPNRFTSRTKCEESCNVIGEESSVDLPPARTTCEEHKNYVLRVSRGRLGVYTPQCTPEGAYEIMQCHSSTGECWCVTEQGQEINGTRKGPGPQVQRPDCHALIVEPTVCQRQRQFALDQPGNGDRYVPECLENGEYKEIQCYGDSGYCWCVNQFGEEIEATRTEPGGGKPDCNPTQKPPCFELRDSIISGEQTGVYIPECTPEGLFTRLQCEGADECLCVNETNGDVLFPVGQAVSQGYSSECDEAHLPDITECQRHRSRILVDSGSQYQPGKYVPQCTEEGEYEEMQCYGSTGFCWCVNLNGEEIDETRTPPGFERPDCLEERRRATPCHAELDDVQNSGLIGALVPQCTDAGLYEHVQCHASTGYCFCVNETTGETFPGSYGESRGVRPECSEYYQEEITEILPEVTTYKPSSLPESTTQPSSGVSPISETFTTLPNMEFGVLTEDLDNMGLVTIKADQCEYSFYGCCPDGVTSATSEDMIECPGVFPPSIDVGTGLATGLQDGTVTLHCSVGGIPEPSIKWSRDGTHISAIADNRMYVGDDGSLTITFVRESDAGPYECSAYNGIGQPADDVVVLDVYTPVDIPQRGQTSLTVKEGSQAVFNCHASGNPKPIVTWTSDGIVLPNAHPRIVHAENDSLIIDAVELGNAGTYVCTGRNLFGTVQRKEFTLIVEADVRIITPPHNTSAEKGDTIVLTCGSTGSPKPTVRWSLNGAPIMAMDSRRFSMNNHGDLTITKLKKSHAGVYECTAANGMSTQSARATVEISKGTGAAVIDPTCTDNPDLANCILIVAIGYCNIVEYSEICCRSCTEHRQFGTTPGL